ncbi:MAG: DUF6497 family protein [Pseudomonadota bacterium]
MATMGYAETKIPVPSGQDIFFHEALLDEAPGALWLRLRFVAPAISKTDLNPENTMSDLEHLCAHLAVPYVEQHRLTPAVVVISLADRRIPFGARDPDATQFFEAYRLENARCIWEGF